MHIPVVGTVANAGKASALRRHIDAIKPLYHAQVMKLHREAEAVKDVERRQEAAEKSSRDRLQERDDTRKRTRQERLHELRTGDGKTWVALSRTM